MTMMTVNGDPFRVCMEGPEDAPVIMFSNSVGSDLSMWDGVVKALGGRFRTLRYDARGHGQSTAPDRPYSLDELGRDALGIMDGLGLDRAHWCGLSLGGMVGMWLATHAPQRLEKLVLANTAAQMGPPNVWNGRIHHVKTHGVKSLVEGTMQRWFTAPFLAGDPPLEAVRAMIAGTSSAGYAGACAAVRDMDQREAIRAITLPTLIIAGTQDQGTTLAMAEAMQASIPGAKLHKLEAAHLSALEHPAAFAEAISAFLAG